MATRVQGAPTAVVVTDSQACVLGASNPMCVLLGWSRIELPMLSLAELGLSETVLARIRTEADAQGLATGPALFHHRDGTPIPARYHVTRIDLTAGRSSTGSSSRVAMRRRRGPSAAVRPVRCGSPTGSWRSCS